MNKKEFLKSKLFNYCLTAIATVVAIFVVWGGPAGVKQDAEIIQREFSDNSHRSSVPVEVSSKTESKKMDLAVEENTAKASSTYTTQKPEAPVQSNPDRIDGYQFRVSEKTGYHCLTSWLEKHNGLTKPGGELNIEHHGPRVLYGGSKGYYVYSIHGIRGMMYPLVVLVDDADGNLWYSQTADLNKLGAYDRLDRWYAAFVTEK